MTKPSCFLKTLFVALLYCSPSLFAAGPTVSTLFTHDLALTEQTLLFQQEKGLSSTIARARIHLLNSNDCQTGYAGVYDTFIQDEGFPISIGQPFGLNASIAYQAAVSVLGESDIENVHSFLIRMLSSQKQFAWFSGLCEDQDVNCCVPVDCSNATGTCLAQHDLSIQLFAL